MESTNGIPSGGQRDGFHVHLRQDKHQPIIIQNFELLTRNQLKFKKKALSTANLYLSSASLSRQKWGCSEHRRSSQEMLESFQSGTVGAVPPENLSAFASQACDVSIKAGGGSTVVPPNQPYIEENRSDHVPFFEPNPKSASLTCNKKLWRTGLFKSTSDVNNNSNTSSRDSADGDVKPYIVVRTPETNNDQIKEYVIREDNQDNIHSKTMNSAEKLVTPNSNTDSSITQAYRDSSKHEPTDVLSNSRAIGQVSAGLDIGHEPKEALMTSESEKQLKEDPNNLSLLSETEDKASTASSRGSSDFATVEDVTEKGFVNIAKKVRISKKVSFKVDDEDKVDDKNDSKARTLVETNNNSWRDSKRNSTFRNKQGVLPSAGSVYLIPQIVDASSLFNDGQTSSPKLGHTSSVWGDLLPPSSLSNGPKSPINSQPAQTNDVKSDISARSKSVKLNFLKAEFELYRKCSDTSHSQINKSREYGQRNTNTESIQPDTSKYSQRHKLSSNFPENHGVHIQTSIDSTEVVENPTEIDISDFLKPKSQSEINAQFLMQNYSANGDRRHNNQIVLRSVKNATEIQEFSREANQNQSPNLELLKDMERGNKGRPRSHSASLKHRTSPTSDKLAVLESVMFTTDRKIPERTLLNKRLEQVVLGSLNTGMPRSTLSRPHSTHR